MSQHAPERDGPPRARPPEGPRAPGATRAQQARLVAIGACLLAAGGLWAANLHPYAVLAVLAALIASVMFIRAAVRARDRRSEGADRVRFPQLIFRRTPAEPSAPPQEPSRPLRETLPPQEPSRPPREGRPSQEARPPQEAGPLAEYRPGAQGHPLPGHNGPRRGPGGNEAPPPGTAAPGLAWDAAALPGPPVFDRPSAPGQAPWYLPAGAAPSGLAADGVRLGDLEVRAASVVGAGHRCEEPALPRQDAYALGRTKDGRYLAVAVADGVSQSKHADLAARVAVNAATRELARMVESGGLGAIDAGLLYTKIAGEIVGTGRDRGIPDADVCAILVTAVIPAVPRPDGTRPLWASWIGDVSLWISRNGELLRSTGQDKSGLDRNALRAVLPFSPDQVEQLAAELHPYDRVVLMTDGVSDSMDSIDSAMDYFARQWAGPPPHPAAFLHGLCYDGPGQTDDRTAVAVWCNAAGPGDRRAAGERR